MATSRSGSRHSARPAGAVATGSLDGSSIFKVYCEGGKIFEFDFMHEMERPGGLQVLKEQFVDFLRAHALIPPGVSFHYPRQSFLFRRTPVRVCPDVVRNSSPCCPVIF